MSEEKPSDNPNAWPGMRLYELIHFKIGKGDAGNPENQALQDKWIGTYRSEQAAIAAAERLRPLVGFRRWPNGFRIYPVEVDRYHWPDGFSEADANRSFWEWPKDEIVPA